MKINAQRRNYLIITKFRVQIPFNPTYELLHFSSQRMNSWSFSALHLVYKKSKIMILGHNFHSNFFPPTHFDCSSASNTYSRTGKWKHTPQPPLPESACVYEIDIRDNKY